MGVHRMEDFQAFQEQRYLNEMRPVFNKRALYSDTTGQFVIPAQPAAYSEVRIRFRTAKKNVDRVFFVWQGLRQLMRLADSDDLFDYFEIRFQLDNEKVSYYFLVESGTISCCYDFRGPVSETQEPFYFSITPGFSTPAWAQGAVMYQIFTDRFYNGDPGNDVLDGEYEYLGEKSAHVTDWSRYPAGKDVHFFYGGDLAGVLEKLDYLQGLGVEALYFNPLFVSPSNHKYDTQDYDHIDPHFGKIVRDEGRLLEDWETDNVNAVRYRTRVTDPENLRASDELFIRLVQEAHRRGMRVILDGVFNHCGSFHKWMDREGIYGGIPDGQAGAYRSPQSPWREFFHFQDSGGRPEGPAYEGWWGYETMPKLNYEGSRQLEEEILRIGRKWVSEPFCADGWRLDMAADLGHSPEYNHHFWMRFRQEVKRANPDALILAEHYGDPLPWLDGNQWDGVMNYDAFLEPVSWFFTGMEKHSDDRREDLYGNGEAFQKTMMRQGARLAGAPWFVCMNELSNHDHSRFLTRTNRKVGRENTLGPEAAQEGIDPAVFREAVVLQMTWPGAPTVYYGDEAGLCGFTDPDSRRAFPWGREDLSLVDFHREIIRIHRESQELRTGSFRWLKTGEQLLAYGRFDFSGQTLVAINNGTQELSVKLPVWELGVPYEGRMRRLLFTCQTGWNCLEEEYTVSGGNVCMTVPAHCAVVLRSRREGEPAEEDPTGEPAKDSPAKRPLGSRPKGARPKDRRNKKESRDGG